MLKSKHKFYNKLILYFSIILLICVVGLASVLYYFSSNAINEEIHNANVNSLNYIVKNMEISLKSIDFLSSQIAIDPTITYFARNNFADDYMRLFQLTGNMDSHKMTNSLVHSIYLYYNGKDSIISSPDGKVKIDDFNDKDWIQKLSFNNQPEWIFNRKVKTTGYKEDSLNILTYVRYLPVGSIQPEGALLININVNELHKLYQRNDERSSGIIVFNESNDEIFSTIDEEIDIYSLLGSIEHIEKSSSYSQAKFNGKSYAIAYSIGANGWKYFMVTPTLKLMAMSNIFRKIIILGTISILVIGVLLSLVFSKKLYNPVRKLMGTFKLDLNPCEQENNVNQITNKSPFNKFYFKKLSGGQINTVDEFGIIENSVNTLIHKNDLLEEKTNKSMNYAVERIVLGLLNGNVIFKDLKDFGIDMNFEKFNKYMVIVVEIDEYKDLIKNNSDEDLCHMQSYMLKKFDNFSEINKISFLKGVSTYPYQSACLLAFNLELEEESLLLEQVFSVCDNIRIDINKLFGTSVTVGFSMIGNSASDIYSLYQQACNAVSHRIFLGKNCVQYYGQISFWDKTVFIFPRKQEEEMLKALLSLDNQKVAISVRAFVDYIKDYKVLDHNQVYYIFAQVLGSITKAAYELGGSILEVWEGEDIYKKLSSCDYMEDMEKLITSVANKYISYFEEKKNNRYKAIIQTAIDYMSNNYGDDQLSLAHISEKVYLSSSHFEKIFKDITGKSVIDYLNNIRMEKAKFLLKDSNLKIETIAEKVGYLTSKGFIRAFKKFENNTPGQYRQKILSHLVETDNETK